MLRRKPTAITITTEDLSAFEEAYARKLAYTKYLKTGEDPNGFFRAARPGEPDYLSQQELQQERQRQQYEAQQGHGGTGGGGVVDPSDELKPLPGAKASIVRSREERIMGTGSGSGSGSGSGGGSAGGGSR